MVGNVTRWLRHVDSIKPGFVLKDAVDDFVGSAIREERQNQTGRMRLTNIEIRYTDGEESQRARSIGGVLDTEIPDLISEEGLTLNDWED